MRIELHRASDLSFRETRDISTLEDLLAIAEEFDSDVIIGKPPSEGPSHVWIYDDYIE